MSNQHEPENLEVDNQQSLQSLVRAITLSEGEFSLILLRCNYAVLRQRMVERLHQLSPVQIREITLPASVKTLYTAIKEQLGDEQPPALMVFGLESVKDIDTVLTAANRVREQFSKQFPFPILLWVNDQTLQKLIRLAADLENWASIIEFETPTPELFNLLRQTTGEVFTGDVRPTLQICQELKSAHQDLKQRREVLNFAITASLEFVLGFHDYLYDKLDLALVHYQQSLTRWRTINDFKERQGIVLIHIGLLYSRQAVINPLDNQISWETARNYLQDALEIFEEIQRLDLSAKYINHLGEALRHLTAWSDLQSLAEKALPLHEEYGTLRQLAQDHGFLAEVALQESRWQDARKLANNALQILNDISSLAPYELSLYQFILACADQGLGEVTAAIEHLEIAKTASNPQYDPQLYILILERLRLLYFNKNEYRLAFNLKQEQLQIEHQYGFRAFVGASYLNPQKQAINPAQLQIENTDSVAQEIAASGRSQDVKRLRERISGTEHKLTVIHGQSGVGKSSILQGGLIPALQQKPIEGRDVLPILLRVYTNWVEMLGQCLKSNIQSLNASSLNSPDAIVAELRKNADRNLLTVLIFDQFEEFFFVYPDQGDRRSFYEFLHICLDIPFVKVILSLREDYLHYLLELERLFDLGVINNNILAKNIRYYLGNFSPEDATTVIETLTRQNLSPNLSPTRREALNSALSGSVGLEGVIAEETRNQSSLEAALIDQLVQDLAGKIGEVRPIELQLVGMQLQTEKITTLKQYQDFGTKENLVEGFLESVIKDCGAENERAARLILYLLTDENGTRPLKTRAELTAKLAAETDRLDLILDIFVQSGLVLLLPESPADRYQLVHDYLVSFVRQQQDNELLAKLALAEEQLKQEQEAKKILAAANQEAEAKIREGQKRFKISSRLSVFLLIVSGMASVYAVIQVGTASKANENQQQAERKLTKTEGDYRRTTQNLQETERKQAELQRTARDLEIKSKDAEAKFKDAQKENIKATQNLAAAKTDLEKVNQQAAALEKKNAEAEARIKTATERVRTADEKAQQAQQQQQQAESQVAQAEITLKQAQEAQQTAKQAAQLAQAAQQEAQKGTELERAGVNAIRQFEFTPLEGLVTAVKTGKELKTLVKDNRPLDEYPAISPIYALHTILSDIKERNQFHGHQGRVFSVSFSPDGKTIATASSDGTARLWTLNGQLLQEFKGHQGIVRSVSFSPDGKTIATASSDGTARLWTLDGQMLQEFKGHQGIVRSVSFSPDGKTIATASDDRTARLWTLDGQLLQELKGHQGEIISVSFSPDGKTIATASSDGTARLWTLDGQLLQELKGHQGEIISVSFSPDGKTIATASSDRTARLWTLNGQLLQEFKGHQGEINSVSFSPDGKTIATASSDRTARLWTLNGQLLQEFKGHQGEINSVSFSPDGKTIATASSDRTARLWTLNGQLLQEFKGHQGEINSVSFSPDGKTIATASFDQTARLWTLDGQLLQEFKGHQGWVWSVSFSPDGKTIATASSDQTARLWTLDGQLLQEFKGHQGWVWSVSFSPDGKTIATASSDQTARLWTLDGQLLQEFKGHQGEIISVSFSPDGKTIATASSDQTAWLWTLDGQLLQEFKGHQGWVWSVSFSPDGKTIATASSDRTARLWTLDGQLLQEFKGHQGIVYSVSFSPDGKTIATASSDRTARLWTLNGQLLQEFKGHQGEINSVSFSPDGKTIATASDDRTARLWPVESLDELLVRGCAWLDDYLQHNSNLSEDERGICQ